MSRSRLVRVVVCDERGAVLGLTPYRTTPIPWWQEVEALRATFPELLGLNKPVDSHVVLRLVEAEHDPDGYLGGRSSHLVQVAAATVAAARAAGTLTLEPWLGAPDVATGQEPLRHPWAKLDGPADDLAWVARQVTVNGPAVQRRTWNLSAIWSVPTDGGDVWLKCVPPFCQHETAVLKVLSETSVGTVPTLLAAEGHRQLLAQMDGRDGYDATPEEQLVMVDALVNLQLAAVDRVDDLLAQGVPDFRRSQLIDQLTAFLNRVAPTDDLLQRLAAEFSDRLDAVDAFGLPDVLVHGDPHAGNCRAGVVPAVWFDWSDSFIGNPLLDFGAVHRMSPPAVSRWLQRWADQSEGSDVTSIWETLKPIALVRAAWVYQHFLDNIEPAEHIYHHNDVQLALSQVRQLLSTE